MAKTIFNEISGTTQQIISQVKSLIKEGGVRRMIVKTEKGKVLLDVPLTAGVVGTAVIAGYAPIISALSMYLLFVNDIHVYVEKYPNGVQNLDEDEYDISDDVEVIDIEDQEEDEAQKEDKQESQNHSPDEENK